MCSPGNPGFFCFQRETLLLCNIDECLIIWRYFSSEGLLFNYEVVCTSFGKEADHDNRHVDINWSNSPAFGAYMEWLSETRGFASFGFNGRRRRGRLA